MKFLAIVTVLVLVLLSLIQESFQQPGMEYCTKYGQVGFYRTLYREQYHRKTYYKLCSRGGQCRGYRYYTSKAAYQKLYYKIGKTGCCSGYGGSACKDINECQSNNGNCQQNCLNGFGSYHCSCNTGYLLHSDRHKCIDINECLDENAGCIQICVNTPGSYKCRCINGYRLQADGHNCKAICSQGCHNGGTCVSPSVCRCNTGWEGHDCKRAYCSQGCYNGGLCTHPDVCKCSLGWTGHDCNTPICTQGCYNGGFCISPDDCRCSLGWTGFNCTTPICSSGCYNGGTCMMPESCSCVSGWTGRHCRIPICSQGCHHGGTCISAGICSCRSGWTGSNCTKPHCSQGCHNGGVCISAHTCTCRTGWTGPDCKTAQCPHGCYNGGICIRPNICGCKIGWTGYNCTTPHCSQGCYNGRCVSTDTCNCFMGWSGTNCTKDINECIDPKSCGFNQRCINTAGSYKCECLTGYKPYSGVPTSDDSYYHCTDINECEDNHGCSQICNNQIGSFNCECRNGYILQADGKQCLDVNECLDDNTGCDHTCANTPGSYYCKCSSGYVLQSDKHNCTDIMECKDGLHNCSQICIELEGDFTCSCYGGFELLEDGVSCKEIDLCETGISGCQQLCIKTNGSFYCDCLTGFELQSDNMTCQDIKECDQINGGCSQICTNTFGSYKCACKEGYTLDFDGFNCTALPCSYLMDPQNGQYMCDGPQLTGAVCRLKCNRGYKLVGAKKRKCLSTSKWSENNSFCEIFHCDELNNPENGNIILPCATELGTTCRITCSLGYYTNSTNLTQNCELVNENTTKWSEPPKCIEKQMCYPNPCKHNGSCTETEEDTFVCECDGIGYTGKTCNTLLIDVPEFSTLAVNSSVEVSFSSYPDREFVLYLDPDDKNSLRINPKSMMFSQDDTHHNVKVKAIKAGKYTLNYKIKDQTLNYQPIPSSTILATTGTFNKSEYFDNYGLKPGLLKPGCCSSEELFHIKCSSDVQLILKSTCGWNTDNNNIFYSPGIIFSSHKGFDMPIAIAGAKLRLRKSSVALSSLNKDEFESDCNTCNNGNDADCNIMPISLNDVRSFLCYESLASTYFSFSSKLIPKWLKLNTLLTNRTHDIHSYIVDLVSTDYLKNIGECGKLTAVTDGLYSVMLYSGSLKVKIDRESVQLQSNSSTGFCFALNLCEKSPSPLYISLPDDVQAKLHSLEFMHDLKSKGWTISVNSLVISDSGIIIDTADRVLYWNGKDFFTSHRRQPNMFTSVKINKQFSNDNTVKASWVFNGNVIWFHDKINKAFNLEANLTWDVYFNGSTRLSISVPVYGGLSSLHLVNNTEPSLLLGEGLNNNVTCHGCSDPSGIAFKLIYHVADASTGLFSTLLTIPQKGIDPRYICPLDSFIFLNRKHDLEALSIFSSCFGINLGLFPIQDLETYIYIFNECKIGLLCSVLSYTDANIIVWSKFPSSLSKLSLGYFLELLPVSNSNRTGLVATFSKDHNHLKAALPSIKVSLFDTTFKSEAIIDEQQLTFSKSVKLFNKYRVRLNGRINQMNNWKNIAVEVQGVFLNNPDNIPRLLCYYIAKYIDILYNRSQIEMNNAEAVYNRAVSQFIKTNMTYNKYKFAKNQSSDMVKQIAEKYKNVNNTVYLITENLEKASDKVKNLKEDIDNLCTIKKCSDVCIPQHICKECRKNVTVPILGTCIFECSKAKNVTVIVGSEVVTRNEYVPQENCNTQPLCQPLPCVSTPTCETEFISQPVDYISYKTETILINTVDTCYKPCSETVVPAPLTTLCCANFTCNSTEQDVECLNQNWQCAQKREIVYSNLDEAVKNAAEILQSLDEAKTNETVVKMRLQHLKLNYDVAEKKFTESKRAYSDAASVLEIATSSFEAVKNKLQLSKLETVKNLGACGLAPSFFFEIKSVSFDTTIITESPTLLAVDVIMFLVSKNITVTETLYINFNNLDGSLKQGAVAIIEKLILSQNTLSQRNTRSSVNESALNSNELYFQRKCADVKNILDYIKELNASIFTVAASTISSISSLKDNVLELSKLINYSSSIFSEELTIDSQIISDIINRNLTHFNSTNTRKSDGIDELIMLMQEYVLNSQELENEIGSTLFQSWQAKMEELHNQTGSAAGFSCTGFSGCLQKVVDTLNDLIIDIPLNGILSDFSIAAQSLMDLALLEDYNIISAVTNAPKIYNIASNPVITDYWCADTPRIIDHPEKYINSTENATIKLSCIAEIEEFTSYQWKKDGIQLLDQKNSTLVLTNVTLSDSGNYTCVVTNQVGSTASFIATVEILQFPSFFLEPNNVYEYLGNLNGASFQCNASGFPLPGYKWYFQPNGMKGFNEIPDHNQNTLVIVPPLPKDEGSYYCEAFIGNVSIRSRVANLTVLHSTVAQIAQTVYLNFSFLNKVDKTETESSAAGSGNELTIEEKASNYFTSDFSGSGNNEIGSGINRNITITPYTKLALEKNLLDVLSTLMSFESTTVENISLLFVTPFNLAVSFTLYSQNIAYSEASFSKMHQLAPQAMMKWENIWQKLQELLSMSGFIITDDEYEYESMPSSLKVDMLQFVCPVGKEVSSANNLICANCPPGSYQILDVRRVVDENDGRVTQYVTPECASCPIGYYQDEQGHATCKQCPSALTSGAKECLAQCSPGEYSQTGLEPCLACPNETHSFINGSTTCHNCSDEKHLLLCPIHKIRYCPQGCSNNGTCVSPYTCVCTASWTGNDCNTASTVKFSQLTYSTAEDNGPLQPVLILSNSLSTNITVQVVDVNETAVVGIDYHSGPYNVTFPAGVTSVLFNIPIYDDDMPEDNENFSIVINTDSLPDGVTIGSPSRVIMIIRNDDTECAIPKLDIVFVLDVSISIKNEQNFGVMKDFVKSTADLVNINLNNSLAAVVLFGGNAWIRFSLTEYTDKNNFQKAVDDIKYEDVKQVGTNTPDALNLLRIAGEDGRLSLRKNTIKIVLLITDGRPNLNHLNVSRFQATADTQEAATKLHDSGIYDQVYSVGIEGNKPIGKILKQIANPPSLVFPLTGFDATLFQQLTQNFTSSFCDDGTKPPQ